MRPNLHRCAVPGCPCDIPRHLLMCMDHWRRVPAPLQREVTAAWKAVRKSMKDEGRPALSLCRAHSQAAAKAVDEVVAKAHRKQAELTEQFGDLFPDTPAAAGDTTKNDSDGNSTTTPSSGQAAL